MCAVGYMVSQVTIGQELPIKKENSEYPEGINRNSWCLTVQDVPQLSNIAVTENHFASAKTEFYHQISDRADGGFQPEL